jgi:hypothetical protein
MQNVLPSQIKIYHIVHISKLPAIIAEGFLLSDAEVRKRKSFSNYSRQLTDVDNMINLNFTRQNIMHLVLPFLMPLFIVEH